MSIPQTTEPLEPAPYEEWVKGKSKDSFVVDGEIAKKDDAAIVAPDSAVKK